MFFIASSLLLSARILAQKLPIAWGAATSAYQIEGAIDVDGKGQSVWDKFFTDPIRANGANGNIAADHYNRMKEDIAYLGELGMTAYRFSVAWPRIIPDCSGAVNEKGIKFYSDMIDEIIKNGAIPVMTLWHWETPQACEDKYGSWLNKQIVQDFTSYAEVVLDRLGSKVEYVLTVNEAGALCGFGYGQSQEVLQNQPFNSSVPDSVLWPPGIVSANQEEGDKKKSACLHHTNLAHASVVKMARKKYANKFKFSMPLIVSYGVPYDQSPETMTAIDRFHEFQVGWHWGPLTVGDYPDVLKSNDYWKDKLLVYTDSEKEILKDSMDYIGLNYYSAGFIRSSTESAREVQQFKPVNQSADGQVILQRAETSWQYYYPQGIRGMSKWFYDKYKKDVWITECGTSVKLEKTMSLPKIVDDTFRSGFYREVLDALTDSINIDKIPIKGFLAWSLLDNFEWLTYDQRFGLISVERGDDQSKSNSLKRTVKNSAYVLRDYFKDNATTPFKIPTGTGTNTPITTPKNNAAPVPVGHLPILGCAKFLEAEPLVDQLTSKDYHDSVNSGHWIVFFGSKQCIHCKSFTPDWLTLQQESKAKKWDTFVKMGKVDCPTYRDLCPDIEGYPTLKYLKNGKFVEELIDRDLPYLRKKMESIYKEALDYNSNAGFNRLKALATQDKVDDPSINQGGEAVELTDANFEQLTIGKPWLMMFYAPWCGHCKQFKPIYKDLAPKLVGKVNVGLVDCTVHAKTCDKYGIRSYPNLYFLNEPEQHILFTGPRTAEGVSKFALDLIDKPSFIAIQPKEIKDIISKSDNALIFVTDASKESELQVIHAVAKSIRGQIPFYICPSSDGFKYLGLTPIPDKSTLILYTDFGLRVERHLGVFVDTPKNKKYIIDWINDKKTPLVPEFTVETQESLTKSPFLVILIMDPSDASDKQSLITMKEIALQWHAEYPKLTSVRFCFLDGMQYSGYAESVYGVKIQDFPKYVITHPKDEIYYDSFVDGKSFVLEKESVFAAIVDSMDGKAHMKSTKGYLGLVVLKTKHAVMGTLGLIMGSLVGFLGFVAVFCGSVYVCCFRSSGYSKVATDNLERKLD